MNEPEKNAPLDNKTVTAKSSKRKRSWLAGRSARMLLVALGFGGLGTYFLVNSFATTLDLGIIKLDLPPLVNDLKKGINWTGIRLPIGDELGGKCTGLFVAVDSDGTVQSCTHGPDPAPEGVDATVPVAPLVTSSGLFPTASAAAGCAEPGTDGKRVQLIYARASNKADQFSKYLATFRATAQNVNNVYSASAAETGGSRSVRFASDSNCNLVVSRVTMSTTGDDSFGNVLRDVKKAGFTNPDRKYLVFLDSTLFCGLGELFSDDRPGQDNSNNQGGSFAVVGSACWTGYAAAHELTHMLGSVQSSAPNVDKYQRTDSKGVRIKDSAGNYVVERGAHCWDDQDIMCYKTSPYMVTPLKVVCSSSTTLQTNRLDCGKNDYFHTNPPQGSYLATHWNIARSAFLVGGGPAIAQDLYFIKTKNTASAKIELQRATAASKYVTRNLATATRFPLSESASGVWQMAGNDLYFVKYQNTASGKVEVQTATAASNYASGASYVTVIPVAEVDKANPVFLITSSRSLIYIKPKTSGGLLGLLATTALSLSEYSAASSYTSQTLTATLPIAVNQLALGRFDMVGNDLAFFKTRSTNSEKMELNIIPRSSGFTSTTMNPTYFPISGDTYGIATARDIDRDGANDAVFIQTKSTTSGKVVVLSDLGATYGNLDYISKPSYFTAAEAANGVLQVYRP